MVGVGGGNVRNPLVSIVALEVTTKFGKCLKHIWPWKLNMRIIDQMPIVFVPESDGSPSLQPKSRLTQDETLHKLDTQTCHDHFLSFQTLSELDHQGQKVWHGCSLKIQDYWINCIFLCWVFPIPKNIPGFPQLHFFDIFGTAYLYQQQQSLFLQSWY